MKRFFTILLACVLTLPLAAQVVKTKKVAILEVVDREGTIGYGVKLQLRASLTSAITQTPGYEGYDRVDMAAIFGEHDFQRTGVVSDDQIKKLGEMSGCDYVLIAEAAIIDANNIILVAKVVNVTTGRVEMSADNMIATNANGIRKGGQQLADTLFSSTKHIASTESQKQTIEEIKPATPVTQSVAQTNSNYGGYGQNRPIPYGVKPGMRYKEYKSKYNTYNYNSSIDRHYSPWLAATNLMIPGLSQMLCGEFGRGALMAGGYFLCYATLFTDAVMVGSMGITGLLIYSIFDGVKVAKIKSMYVTDMQRYNYGCTFDVSPSLECIPTYNGLQTSAGMKLTVTF